MAKRRLVRKSNSVTDKGMRETKKERTRTTFFVRTALNASYENDRVTSFSERKTLIFRATKEKIENPAVIDPSAGLLEL